METKQNSLKFEGSEELIQNWNKIQKEVHDKVIATNCLNVNWYDPSIPTVTQSSSSTDVTSQQPIRYIAGADISFFKEDPSRGIACIAILESPHLNLVYTDLSDFTIDIPYISGYLAFREKDAIIALFEKLKREHPDIYPQVIFVDGNGILHPRGLF